MVLSPRRERITIWQWAAPIAFASLLVIISRSNFLLFHTLAELFAIGVAVTMAVVAWNMHPFTKNNFLMFLGVGYFWVAIIDLFHTLTYQGIGIFPIKSPEQAIELWLAARYLEALVLLIAPLYLSREIRRKNTLILMGLAATAIALFFVTGPMPPMFIEGIGLTAFKITNEYVIIILLLLSAMVLWRNRHLLEPTILKLMFISIALTICAELAFTFYLSVFGFSNLVGHIFKIFSFWLIFLATIQTTLQKPFLALARNADTYDAVPDATIVVDSSGIIRQVNQAAANFARHPVADLIGQHCHEIYHPISSSRDSCPVCQRIKTGRAALNLELRSDSHNRYFDYALAPINSSTTPQGMVQTIRDITARKRAEKGLRESQHYNRMLFESSPVGLALCRMNGELVDINPAYAQIIGRPTNEALQCSYWDITPEKYRAREEEILAQLNQSGSYGPYEKEYRHKDGHLVPVRLNGMLLNRGGETYIWSSVEDITEQRESAKERIRFRSALDSSEDNIFLIDPQTMRFIDCNSTVLSTLGYTKKELLQLGPQDIKTNHTKETLADQFTALATGLRDYIDLDTHHIRKDGSTLPVEVRISRLKTDTTPILIAIARDITARTAIEERLRQAAIVIESTAEAVIVMSESRLIISANKAAAEITGFQELNIINQPFETLVSPHQDNLIYDRLWDEVKSTGRWQGELWQNSSSGRTFPAWTTISTIRNDAGKTVNYIAVFSDISSLKQTQERLDFLAYHDPLTNMPNRLLLNDRLQHSLQVAQRSGEKVAVMFIDLDRFKNVNDSLGHAIGDKLLLQVANRLKLLVREQDTLSRLGGDEFVILLEKIRGNSDVMAIAEKMMSAFAAPFSIDGHTLYMTLSIGISFYPDDGTDQETLIKNADAAMYRAKESGRNNSHFYTSEITDTITENLLLENALRNALNNNEMVLHYQPQYELDTGRLQGAEALIRWNHPSRGQIQPDQFIQLAEESGLIIPIGNWVITSACAQMCDWLAAGIKIETISVNVSGLQLQRGNIVDVVKNALQQTGLYAHHLELEITESTIMSKPEAAIAALNELKALGVMISIDDFGTGYSSLSQLKLLPVDKLKIDQSFVRDIPHDKNDEAIACAVIALGQSMEMRVNAEGIETAEQRNFLLKHGCTEGQGYLYSRPLNNHDFMQLAQQQGHGTSLPLM